MKIPTALLLTIASLCYQTTYATDGNPFTLFQRAQGLTKALKLPWVAEIKTPRRRCSGVLVRGKDKFRTLMVITTVACIFKELDDQGYTLVEIPSFITVTMNDKTTKAHSIYVPSSSQSDAQVAFVKLTNVTNIPPVLLINETTAQRSKACLAAWFDNSGAYVEEQLKSNQCENCDESNFDSMGQNYIDGAPIMCENEENLWTLKAIYNDQKKTLESLSEIESVATSAAYEMHHYKKDEFFCGKRRKYEHTLLSGYEKWSLKTGENYRIYS